MMGHARPMTFLQFNAEGDLLFSCSKDEIVNVWRVETGERLGVFVGHTGSVNCCDISRDSSMLLTASSDQFLKIWETQTGRALFEIKHEGPVLGVAFSEGEHEFATITSPFGTRVGACVNIFPLAGHPSEQTSEPRLKIQHTADPTAKIMRIRWLPLNAGILAAFESGHIREYDANTGEMRYEYLAHEGRITSMSFNANKTQLITSSVDKTCKLWDVMVGRKEGPTLLEVKKYLADTQMNSAAIAPDKDFVLMGGGQEALHVTTTSASAGRFESRVHHKVFENELGRIRGHFGPVNALAYSPDGTHYASGGEDGVIRLHKLGKDYYELDLPFRALDDPTLFEMVKEGGELDRLEAEEQAALEKAERDKEAAAAALGITN